MKNLAIEKSVISLRGINQKKDTREKEKEGEIEKDT